MKKKSNPTNFWFALESIIGLSAVADEWRKYSGSEFESIQSVLRPNGRIAASHPCLQPRDCGCSHNVVIHTPKDIVAVCRCGLECDTFPLKSTQLAIYELDRPKLDLAVATVFNLQQASVQIKNMIRTSCVGQLTMGYISIPVFLTIQPGSIEYSLIADLLLSMNTSPFILLTPLPDLITPECITQLSSRGCYVLSLAESTVIQVKFKLVLSTLGSQFLERIRTLPVALSPNVTTVRNISDRGSSDQIILERREVDGDIHWYVNGFDKGVFAAHNNSKKNSILTILYDEIGNGWVKHDRFITACGWKKEEYFGAGNGVTGRMQKQLNIIRKFLGMKIEFVTSKGVKFPAEVVKSRG